MVRENKKISALEKKRKDAITEEESSRRGTFEPRPLPDEVASSSELLPRRADEISPIRRKPSEGKPTSSPGNSSEGLVSNSATPSEEQMTNSSPAADPAAAVQRKKGNPTLSESGA